MKVSKSNTKAIQSSKLLVVGLLLILFIGFTSAEIISNPKISKEGTSSFFTSELPNTQFNTNMCKDGQDFVLQIAPGGCSPAVVRTDLLESQDVPVFCQIQAIKINPLIKLKSVNSLSFDGSQYPSEVQTIGFYPTYAALSGDRKLNELMINKIGYATIILKQQPNSSALKNCEDGPFGEVCYVEGNLSTNINYDIEGGFGLKKRDLYLPVMDDNEFSKKYGQYSFFEDRGYLRTENVDSNSATFGVYSGLLENPYKSGNYDKKSYRKYNLNVGEETSEVSIPGLDCLAAVKFKLDAIDFADTRAKITVNNQVSEVKVGESFLDGNCIIKDLNKNGLNQNVKIRCEGERTETFDLYITPSITLNINGIKESHLIGDKLYETNDGKTVYLGYANMESGSLVDLKVYLIKSPVSKNRLNSEDLSMATYLAETYSKDSKGFSNFLKKFNVGVADYANRLFSGESLKELGYGKKVDFEGSSVSIVDLGSRTDFNLKGNAKKYYNLAAEDYSFVSSSFSEEKYPVDDLLKLDERALYKNIKLAIALKQQGSVKRLCDTFSQEYQDSSLKIPECSNILELSNTELSTKDVKIESDVKTISFEGIIEPAYADYGAEVLIRDKNGNTNFAQLKKDKMYYLGEGSSDYVRLITVRENSIDLEISVETPVAGVSLADKVKNIMLSNIITIKKDDPKSDIAGHIYTLRNVNLKKVAKISVKPVVNYQESHATFPFKIGIEKRAIQLSPQKTQSRINTLNKTIEKWTSISNSLDVLVTTMKKACLATGAILTTKNLIFGSGGETIARQEVMKGEGGWYEICAQAVFDKTYTSQEQCFLDKADDIDNEVSNLKTAMDKQNEDIKKLQAGMTTPGGLFGQNVVNTKKLSDEYSDKVNALVDEGLMPNPNGNGESVNRSLVKLALLNNRNWDYSIYNIDDLKEIDLYSKLYAPDKSNLVYKNKLYSALEQIENNYKEVASIKNAEHKTSSLGDVVFRPLDINKNKKEEVYDGAIASKTLGGITKGDAIQGVSVNNKKYILTLIDLRAGNYAIKGVYDIEGTLVKDNKTVLDSYSFFKEYDRTTYQNRIKNPLVKYYETEPYKGLPSTVPIDVNEGWYAHLKQTVPTFGNIETYKDSGQVNSFYLCNVGKNGLIEADSDMGDDICQMINLGGAYTNNFPGLSEEKAASLISNAVRAINQAADSYEDGVGRVSILRQTIKVGEPAINSLSTKCVDFMSPKECQILYNVCDPVICPSSRCDFGGSYPVKDVVQSGIIGSLALCLPNANEGIYVPICLTGVKSGIDGLLSVFSAYRDCLDHSLKTGETIGICDEIHSIYLCEFFWRQGLPLAKIALPKIMSILMGQNTRGGGEYMNVEAAWANTQNSVSFFVNNYAVNSFKAFKARSQEQVGSSVCKSFVSLSYPKGQGFLDVLTDTDSPYQFTANFDEIPFTTATNPPMSQYKVFYHIYAGKDKGAYYRVYLRGGDSSSFYQDTDAGRLVGSGYIATGEYATETVDFTAPTGYKELCVRVNNQEECGFKRVSTNFAQNYIKDAYVKNQVTNTDIKTEKECISGSSSVGGLLNLNIQEGVDNVIDPELYNQGIIRTCATDNPGSKSDPFYGTKNQRWKEVGSCGDSKIKCWVDTSTVTDAVNFETTANESLKELTEDYLENFAKDNNYLDDQGFSDAVESINNESSLVKRIKLINSFFDKIFMNNQKAYLYFLRGNTYGNLSKMAKYNNEQSALLKESTEDKNSIEKVSGSASSIDFFGAGYVSPKFEFGDGAIMTTSLKVYDNPCFKFFDEKWHWRESCLDEKVIPTHGTITHDIERPWIDVSSSELNSKLRTRGEEQHLPELKGKNYLEGLKVLLAWVDEPSGLLTATKDLTALIVDTKYKRKSFTVKCNDYSIIASFNNSDNTWYYLTDSDTGRKKSTKIPYSNRYDYQTCENFPSRIITTLGNLDGEDSYVFGAAIMFDWEDYSSQMGTGATTSPSAKLKKLLDMANSMIGETVNDEEVKKINGEAVSCYNSLMVVYERAGLRYNNMKCIYSAKRGDIFTINGKNNIMTAEDPFYANSKRICKHVGGLTEEQKLDLLKQGYQLDLIVYDTEPHSVMFINWSDRSKNLAWVFDWGCLADKSRIYSYSIVDLSDNKHPVYKIREYPIYKESDTVVKTADETTKEIPGRGEKIAKLSAIDFNPKDFETFWMATKCTDCGDSGLCSKEECTAIGGLIGERCLYSKYLFLGGSCKKDTSKSFSGTCNSDADCQKLMGIEIMKIAKEVKGDGISDAELEQETGVPSFECLAVMMGMQESRLKFCKKYQKEGDPLYCEGNIDEVNGDSDKGIMQLNTKYIGSEYAQLDMTIFEDNVRTGLEKLKEDHSKAPGVKGQSRPYINGEFEASYYGWEYTLRNYNGWGNGTNSVADYVDQVLNRQDAVAKMFPECKSTKPLSIKERVNDLRGKGWTYKTAFDAYILLDGDHEKDNVFLKELLDDKVIDERKYNIFMENPNDMQLLGRFLAGRI